MRTGTGVLQLAMGSNDKLLPTSTHHVTHRVRTVTMQLPVEAYVITSVIRKKMTYFKYDVVEVWCS